MKITKQKLEKLYKENLSKDVCKQLNISSPTLRRLLRNNGIDLKGSGNRLPKTKIQVV